MGGYFPISLSVRYSTDVGYTHKEYTITTAGQKSIAQLCRENKTPGNYFSIDPATSMGETPEQVKYTTI